MQIIMQAQTQTQTQNVDQKSQQLAAGPGTSRGMIGADVFVPD